MKQKIRCKKEGKYEKNEKIKRQHAKNTKTPNL